MKNALLRSSLALVVLCSLGFPIANAEQTEAPHPPVFLNETDNVQKQAAGITALRDKVAEQGTAEIIVGLTTPISAPEVVGKATYKAQKQAFRDAAADLSSRVFAEPPTKKRFRPFTVIPYVAMSVTPTELERVLADPFVDNVQADGRIEFVPRLRQMVDLTKADYLWNSKHANQGKGNAIAVIDIGFDSNLPSMKSRIVHEACFSDTDNSLLGCVVNNKGDRKTKAIGKGASWGCKDSAAIWAKKNKKKKTPKFCFKHGTQAASAAAAEAAKVKNFPAFESGFAPRADLFLVRVPTAGVKEITKSVEHIFKNRKASKVRATTMSIGLGRDSGVCVSRQVFAALEAAITILVDSGVPFFNSAGNDGSNEDIDYPGCLENVISVGASEEADKKIAKFSDTSLAVELLAPGDKISLLKSVDPISGTSFTAPAVAAGYTLLKAANKKKDAGEILNAMRCTGKPLSRKGTDVAVPRIDLKAAHKFLQKPKYKQRWNFKKGADSTGWVQIYSSWKVAGGSLKLSSHDEREVVMILNDVCFENYEIEARVFRQYGGEHESEPMGFIFDEAGKYTEDDPEERKFNGFLAHIYDETGVRLTSLHDVKIVERAGYQGTSEILCLETLGGPSIEGWSTIKLRIEDGTMSIYLNGLLRCDAEVDTSKVRSVGFMAFARDPDPKSLDIDYIQIRGLE